MFTEDWSALTDEALQERYDNADALQGVAFLLKCKAVHAYRENHVQAWGTSWLDHAIERFNVSRPTIYSYANIWEIVSHSETNLPELVAPLTDSRSLMQFIGRKNPEAGAVAMEAAVAHYAEYNEPPTVKALAGKLGQGSILPDLYSCPDCNFTAQLRGFQHLNSSAAAAKRARYAEGEDMFEIFTCPDCKHKGERPVFQPTPPPNC